MLISLPWFFITTNCVIQKLSDYVRHPEATNAKVNHDKDKNTRKWGKLWVILEGTADITVRT